MNSLSTKPSPHDGGLVDCLDISKNLTQNIYVLIQILYVCIPHNMVSQLPIYLPHTKTTTCDTG